MTVQFNDALYAGLIAKGYVGSLADMYAAWARGKYPFASGARSETRATCTSHDLINAIK